MHELGIARSIAGIVVERSGGLRVTRVGLEVGSLAAIVPDAIQFCFEVCVRGTVAEGAALDVTEVPARATCRDCRHEFRAEDWLEPCPQCGSLVHDRRGGDEVVVIEIETAAIEEMA